MRSGECRAPPALADASFAPGLRPARAGVLGPLSLARLARSICRREGVPVNCGFPELVSHDQVRLRDRRRRFLTGEGHRRRLPRRDPRFPRRPRHQSQARPVHQRRPWNDEPVPARRGIRHRGRRRDRPRPRPLRALRRRADGQAQQLHDGADLRERHPQGAPRRLPRRHRSGDPAHHRRDQELDRRWRQATRKSPWSKSAAPSATSSRCRSSKRSGRWASRSAARTSATST